MGVNVWSCFGTDLLKKILLVEDWVWFEHDYFQKRLKRSTLAVKWLKQGKIFKILLSESRVYKKWQTSAITQEISDFNLETKPVNAAPPKKFRFGSKWKTFRWFVPLENSRKKWKIWKGRPVFLAGTFRTEFRVPFTSFSYFIPVSVFTNSAAILVPRQVAGSVPYRGLQSNETTFYLSENPFLLPPKSPDFFI